MRLSALALSAAVFAAVAASQPVLAQETASYCARLGPADHVSSRGVPLATVGAIVQQDRANFHKFGRRDPEDEDDPIFANKVSRDALNRRIDETQLAPAERRAIVEGEPIVCVTIEGDQAHITSIR